MKSVSVLYTLRTFRNKARASKVMTTQTQRDKVRLALGPIASQVECLLFDNKRIQAIKVIRETFSLGLREALEITKVLKPINKLS